MRWSIASIFCITVVTLSIYGILFDYQPPKKLESEGSEEALQTVRFQGVTYYDASEKEPRIWLEAEEAELLQNQMYNFVRPKGQVFRESEKVPYDYVALRGSYQGLQGYLQLAGDVQLDQGKWKHYESDQLEFWRDKDFILGRGNVKVRHLRDLDRLDGTSDEMEIRQRGNYVVMTGNVKGEHKRKLKWEPGTKFWADRVVWRRNLGQVDLYNNVRLQRATLKAKGREGQLFLGNYNKELKYFVLRDDVLVWETLQTESGKLIRTGQGERLVGHNRERKLILTGTPVVTQRGDVVRGNRITLRRNSELIEVNDNNSLIQVKEDDPSKD